MILAVLINPMLLALTAAGAVEVCHVAGIQPHLHELYLAIAVFVITSQIALVPLIFLRKRTTASLTQSALAGLVLHLLVAIILAITTLLVTKIGAPFAYWTLLFYWVTLAGLAVTYIRAVGTAAAQPLP